MDYKTEALIAQLRAARGAAGLSQRALSDRAGLAQSHISQIESGKMEPRLASLIDLARALDLEVMLVPRKLVPAVQGMQRLQKPGHHGAEATARPAYALDDGDDDA